MFATHSPRRTWHFCGICKIKKKLETKNIDLHILLYYASTTTGIIIKFQGPTPPTLNVCQNCWTFLKCPCKVSLHPVSHANLKPFSVLFFVFFCRFENKLNEMKSKTNTINSIVEHIQTQIASFNQSYSMIQSRCEMNHIVCFTSQFTYTIVSCLVGGRTIGVSDGKWNVPGPLE